MLIVDTPIMRHHSQQSATGKHSINTPTTNDDMELCSPMPAAAACLVQLCHQSDGTGGTDVISSVTASPEVDLSSTILPSHEKSSFKSPCDILPYVLQSPKHHLETTSTVAKRALTKSTFPTVCEISLATESSSWASLVAADRVQSLGVGDSKSALSSLVDTLQASQSAINKATVLTGHLQGSSLFSVPRASVRRPATSVSEAEAQSLKHSDKPAEIMSRGVQNQEPLSEEHDVQASSSSTLRSQKVVDSIVTNVRVAETDLKSHVNEALERRKPYDLEVPVVFSPLPTSASPDPTWFSTPSSIAESEPSGESSCLDGLGGKEEIDEKGMSN